MVFMICILAGTSVGYAQDAVPFPEYRTKRLLNSMQIVVAPTPYLDDSLSIGLVVRYGSAFDGARKSGVAHFLQRMFIKATVDKNTKGLQEELKYLGAKLEVHCDWDGFQFLLESRSAAFERALLLLYQVVCEAQFSEKDFDSVKSELLQELRQAPDPRSRIHDLFNVVLFGGTTYGRMLQGTPETVQSITLGDLKYFYNKYFSPNAASLVIAGNVDPSLVLDKASRIWGLWIRKDRIPFTFAPSREPSDDIYLIEDDPGSSAVEFILGSFSPRRQDPVFNDVLLTTQILRQRLRNLLPTSLLTIGLDGRRMPGALYVQGQAAAEDSIDQILKIQEALEAMKQNPVSQEELAQAQNYIIEQFNRDLKTTEGVCRATMDSELYRLGSYYITAFPDRIRNCDANSVRQAARKYFLPGKKIMLLRGPVKALLPELKRLGPFKQIAQ